jgi:transposase
LYPLQDRILIDASKLARNSGWNVKSPSFQDGFEVISVVAPRGDPDQDTFKSYSTFPWGISFTSFLTAMKKRSTPMEIVNPYAAGIDVGSRSHFVAVGQGETQVREFGVYESDLRQLAQWLHEHHITTVAMESTGTYWQNLFTALQQAGLEVLLCNGKFTKNIKGRKTDVQDCQWIQRLHSLGLLTGSFLPDDTTEELRTYCRHRTSLLETAAVTTQKMHKYLRLLNLRLDVVVRDVTGQTGMAIIEAICRGETNPETLASFRHGNCRKSREEIARALRGNGRRDLLFALT